MIERHVETTWRVRTAEGDIVHEESPFEAAVLDFSTWLTLDNRTPNKLALGVCRYLLREGTDDLVAKVAELREWLKKEEERG